MIFSPDRRLLRPVAMGGGAALLALLLCVAGLAAFRPAAAEPQAAQQALAKATGLLAAGNASGARDAALAATRDAPDWGKALAVLARAHLALGDGAAAEATLGRAVAAGFARDAALPDYAAAYVLQGQPERALDTLDRIDGPPDAQMLDTRGRALQAMGDFEAARDAFEAAAELAPDDARAWIALARFRRAAGDVAGAIVASRRAVAADRNFPEALYVRAGLVREQYGLTASLPWYEAALQGDPGRAGILLDYAATLGEVGRARDMLAAVRKAMAIRPGDAEGFYLQAVLAARAGKFDLARSILQRAGDAAAGIPGALLLAGALDIEAGGYQQAIEGLHELVARQPTNLAARRLLGLAYLHGGATADAIDLLRPMAARDDADSYTLSLFARALEETGDHAAAARYLDRAARPMRGRSHIFSADDSLAVLRTAAAEAPGDIAAQIALVRGLIASGADAEAQKAADALAADHPGAPQSHILTGDVLMARGRFAGAAEAYAQAADIRFDEPVMLRLVEALDRTGRREAATNVLALFLSQNPINVAALRLAGHWQLAAGDFDAAIATLEALRRRIGDGDAAVLAELATAHAGAGDAATGVDYGKAAFALAPANPAVADAYGWALLQAGRKEDARQLLLKAVRMAPDHAGLRWHLAQAYAALGRTGDAAEQARAALSHDGFRDRQAAEALVRATA
ncbi:tetratricopeptide repeat protein [Stakelama saccharophila]|uniref:Tetratricopeptide repeat protein n=1 Tax=Stakelama saccharophila TaxID=3075605 RepID=A0ABZ0BAB1_9SPHN|nr:tetratricopeptide repeat protein [Stakelama sp. W311]WNO54137.1 tetratricopeptide repeat protein [Stakelama sp. W311]